MRAKTLLSLPVINRPKFLYSSNFLNSNSTAEKIISKLDQSLNYYKDSQNLHILDAYSAHGIWSTHLYNRLLPHKHLMLECRPQYTKLLENYLKTTPTDSTMSLCDLDPYDWGSYTKIMDEKKVLTPGYQTRDHIHTDMLFTATVTDEALVMQWLSCIGHQNWIQKFGNIKMLLWTRMSSARKLIAKPGNSRRAKCTVMRELYSDAKVIALPDGPILEDFQEAINDSDPVIYNPKDLASTSAKNKDLDLVLLEVNPKDIDFDIYELEYITKQLLTTKTQKLGDTIEYLGPGATNYFSDVLPPHYMKNKIIELTDAQFKVITKAFHNWPFKPNIFAGIWLGEE